MLGAMGANYACGWLLELGSLKKTWLLIVWLIYGLYIHARIDQ
jgi:ABC-type transport system involved in cytochrome c biogenesis permease subunit